MNGGETLEPGTVRYKYGVFDGSTGVIWSDFSLLTTFDLVYLRKGNLRP